MIKLMISMFKLLVVGLLIAFAIIAALITTLRMENVSKTARVESQEIALSNCKPTFVDGGGPYYKSNAPFRNKISPDDNSGYALEVRGTIFESDCKTTVKGAVLDVWQADESGAYQDEWYRGKVKTDEDGNYIFQTVVPKGYGEGTAFRPPHIHFKVWVDGTEVITSQMFFPESKGKDGFDDAYIMKLEEYNEDGTKKFRGLHPIILP